MQARPDGAGGARVAVQDEHVGSPASRSTDATKLRAAVSAAAV